MRTSDVFAAEPESTKRACNNNANALLLLELPAEILWLVFDTALSCGRSALKAFAPTCQLAAQIAREIKFTRAVRLRIPLAAFYCATVAQTVQSFRAFKARDWPHSYPAVRSVVVEERDTAGCAYRAARAQHDRHQLCNPRSYPKLWAALKSFVERTLPSLFPAMHELQLILGTTAAPANSAILVPEGCTLLYKPGDFVLSPTAPCVRLRSNGCVRTLSCTFHYMLPTIRPRLRWLSLPERSANAFVENFNFQLTASVLELFVEEGFIFLSLLLIRTQPRSMVLNLFSYARDNRRYMPCGGQVCTINSVEFNTACVVVNTLLSHLVYAGLTLYKATVRSFDSAVTAFTIGACEQYGEQLSVGNIALAAQGSMSSVCISCPAKMPKLVSRRRQQRC
jgi:hypothetical protein